MAQIITRVDEDLLAEVDRLVEEGAVESRSDAVRRALHDLIERRRRAAIGRAVVEGYERVPQQVADIGWSDEATARMIAEEPW